MPAKRDYKSYTKEELLKSSAIIANQKSLESVVYLTHIKFDDSDDINSYIACKHCNARFSQLDQHLKKWHHQTIKEYQSEYPDADIVSQNIKDKIKGSKNPGYQHKGKLSKFSDNYIHYKDLTESEIVVQKRQTINKSIKTKQLNPKKNHLRLEYYLNKGFSIEESNKLLSERQSTFTLNKCVLKYGIDIGNQIWQARQDKWITSLKNKSKEELETIDKKKSWQEGYFINKDVKQARFYIIRLDKDIYKIGITKNRLHQRYKKSVLSKVDIIYESELMDIDKVCLIERAIKQIYVDFNISKSDKFKYFGWTEVFKFENDMFFSVLNNIIGLTREDLLIKL